MKATGHLHTQTALICPSEAQSHSGHAGNIRKYKLGQVVHSQSVCQYNYTDLYPSSFSVSCEGICYRDPLSTGFTSVLKRDFATLTEFFVVSQSGNHLV
jgi:hypothetical protein